VPLTHDLSIQIEDYLRPNGGIIFPNPNAPTGRLLSLEQIERVVAGNPDSVVVVDEAYIDFGGQSASTLIDHYPNLLVIQTLSKSRAVAGLRFSYALGQAHLIEGQDRVKCSFITYPLDSLDIGGASSAIEDTA